MMSAFWMVFAAGSLLSGEGVGYAKLLPKFTFGGTFHISILALSENCTSFRPHVDPEHVGNETLLGKICRFADLTPRWSQGNVQC